MKTVEVEILYNPIIKFAVVMPSNYLSGRTLIGIMNKLAFLHGLHAEEELSWGDSHFLFCDHNERHRYFNRAERHVVVLPEAGVIDPIFMEHIMNGEKLESFIAINRCVTFASVDQLESFCSKHGITIKKIEGSV